MVRRLAERGGRADRRLSARRDGAAGAGAGRALKANPKLVYGRVTGWGQEGPLAQEAGHDINYVAISGLLHGIGPKERPAVPINYLGDYAGGGMMLAFGMVAALLAVQRRRAGPGDRRGDERRRGADRCADLWPAGRRALARRAGVQPARRRRAELRHLSLPRRQVPRASARSSRSSSEALFKGLALAAERQPRGNRHGDRQPHPRRMGGPFRRHRRLRRAGARPRRSAGASAQSRAANLPRPGWRVPARAGTALFGTLRSTGPIRRAAKGRTGRRSSAELGYAAGRNRAIRVDGVLIDEPALRADGDQRVRAHVAGSPPSMARSIWGRGFPISAGPTEILDAAARALRRRVEPICAVARAAGAARGGRGALWPASWARARSPTMSASPAARPRRLAAAILATVEPGDEVIIFTPAYDAYAPLVRRAGGRAARSRAAAARLADRARGDRGGGRRRRRARSSSTIRTIRPGACSTRDELAGGRRGRVAT